MASRFLGSGLRIGLGIVLGAVFLVLVFRTVDFRDVYALLQRATALPIVVALLAFALDFALRAARFWWMLNRVQDKRLPFGPTVAPFVASFGISDILPLRVGDGFRILWFNRRFAIPLGCLAGAMILERIFDLLTIVFLCALSLALVDASASPVLTGGLQIALALAVVGGVALLFGPSLLARLLVRLAPYLPARLVGRALELLEESADAMVRIGSVRRILALAVVSLGLWLVESIVLVAAWMSLGGAIEDFAKPFIAFAFSTLGTMVPSLPGHFGAFEFFGMRAFDLGGVEGAFAVAVLLLAHLILWLPTALFSIGWLLLGAMPSPGRERTPTRHAR